MRRLKIVVGGYIVAFPLGGMTWHHLNYLLGLHEMGHEVTFLEDSGSYSVPYNPTTWTCEADSTYGREYLLRTFAQYGLPPRYCYYSQFEDRYYGMTGQELDETLAGADLMLCVSGVTPLRAERRRARRVVGVDTDPVFTQLRMGHDAEFAEYWKGFDAVATFGRLIGTARSPLPTHGLAWVPHNQPVALAHWPVAADAGARRFTTLGKWDHQQRDVSFGGRTYRSNKGVEWMKMLELPGRVPWAMEFAMAAMPGPTREQFQKAGWTLADAEAATLSTQAFAGYIAQSAGEFTVAKEIYAGLPSGWFSDRSACYLASGRPVVTQDSGFDAWLPTGAGLFSFGTADEAQAALRAIDGDYARHARAAREIAVAHFDSAKVLGELLDAVM